MTVDFWRIGQWTIVACVAGSLAWSLPPVLRHSAGIVVTEKVGPVTRQQAPETQTPLDLSAVLALAPFGKAQVASVPKSDAPTSALPDLTLKGILSSSRVGASLALIALGAEQNLYREGDALSDRFVVRSVATDHVILGADQGQITLRFDDSQKADSDDETETVAGPSLNNRLRAAAIVADQRQPLARPETTAEYLSYWRRKIRKNPQAVMREIGLEAAGDGYRIAQKHNRGVRLAGLQAGDLVRRVNGRAVGDPTADRQAYDEIAASGQARLEVQRGDKTLTFSFPLR
ncbi:MAG: type II secretion system protein N [Pseudomonadota bacterium]